MSPGISDDPSGHESVELPIKVKPPRSAVRREAELVSAIIAFNVCALPILLASVGMIRIAVEAALEFRPQGATQYPMLATPLITW